MTQKKKKKCYTTLTVLPLKRCTRLLATIANSFSKKQKKKATVANLFFFSFFVEKVNKLRASTLVVPKNLAFGTIKNYFDLFYYLTLQNT